LTSIFGSKVTQIKLKCPLGVALMLFQFDYPLIHIEIKNPSQSNPWLHRPKLASSRFS
jgi:hypothetical protein